MKNKTKTTGKTETEGKTSRVVLNLSLEQARELKGFIYIYGIANPNVNQKNKIFLQKIYERIEKIINKHENSEDKIKRMQEEGADDSEIVQETGYHSDEEDEEEEECPECGMSENECECEEVY